MGRAIFNIPEFACVSVHDTKLLDRKDSGRDDASWPEAQSPRDLPSTPEWSIFFYVALQQPTGR